MSDVDLVKWRVERAGSARNGYAPGWFAFNRWGTGAFLLTFDEAIAFADRQARIEFETYHKRGLLKLASRGVPAAGPPRIHRRPFTDVEVQAAMAMRENGHSWHEIGEVLDRSPSSIQARVWRVLHAEAAALDDEEAS